MVNAMQNLRNYMAHLIAVGHLKARDAEELETCISQVVKQEKVVSYDSGYADGRADGAHSA